MDVVVAEFVVGSEVLVKVIGPRKPTSTGVVAVWKCALPRLSSREVTVDVTLQGIRPGKALAAATIPIAPVKNWAWAALHRVCRRQLALIGIKVALDNWAAALHRVFRQPVLNMLAVRRSGPHKWVSKKKIHLQCLDIVGRTSQVRPPH